MNFYSLSSMILISILTNVLHPFFLDSMFSIISPILGISPLFKTFLEELHEHFELSSKFILPSLLSNLVSAVDLLLELSFLLPAKILLISVFCASEVTAY